MRKALHYLPALIFAGLAVATIIATNLLSKGHASDYWSNSYGPNIAASFIELFFGASFVQWFVDRERKKADEPMKKATEGRVDRILTDLIQFMRILAREGAGEDLRRRPLTSFADLRRRWAKSLDALDFERAAKQLNPPFKSPLERWTHRAEEARRAHSDAAPAIERYCDGELAAALQELMEGEQTRPIWEELLEIIPADLAGGWRREAGDADVFCDAVERCLKAYRESTGKRTLAELQLA